MDKGLSSRSLAFVLLGRSVVNRRMAADTIVEAFDVLEEGEPRLASRAVVSMVDPLGLERMEEALCDGVVETLCGTAHAAERAVLVEQVLVLRGSVLGGFKGSSQQLEGALRWGQNVDGRIVHNELGCVHRVVRRLRDASIGNGSGKE
jgi:hypothetical protein